MASGNANRFVCGSESALVDFCQKLHERHVDMLKFQPRPILSEVLLSNLRKNKVNCLTLITW
jgi:hypothetical protein